jgi:hypothetical protein
MIFTIWLDGQQEYTVETNNMNDALDIHCENMGYIDHADYCDAYGLTKSPFNIVEE